MRVRLKHVKRVRSKGKTYWYHQITRERLPDDREERIRRVVDLNVSLGPKTHHRPLTGSVAAIVTAYKASPEFLTLRERSRWEYSLYLDIICEGWGPLPVTGLQRKHILGLRDKFAETPGKANKVVMVLRILLSFAVERDYLAQNPAKDIKKLKMGEGHATWPDASVDRFLVSAAPTMVLALKLALYTGQRQGDVLRMCWSDYDGERIHVVQSKTGARLWIPIHDTLREALEAEKRVSPIILTTTTGKPFVSASYFRKQFAAAVRDAGLIGLTFHGLRYTAVAKLFEAGCTVKEVASITGHRSLNMVAKYGRDADQERMAGAAILKWENADRTKIGKRR